MNNNDTSDDDKKTLDESDGVKKDTNFIELISKVKGVTIPKEFILQMTEKAKETYPLEAIGLLIGYVTEKDEIKVTQIEYITKGEEAQVEFLSDEDFGAFEKDLKEKKSHIIGWWHSHPGYGLFLSGTDIKTHILSFQLRNPYSIALVIDPTLEKDDDIADFNIYQVQGNSKDKNFAEVPLIIYLS